MPRRRRKKTTTPSYDWSNDPNSVQIKPEWFNNISPEEMRARIEREEKALEAETRMLDHQAEMDRIEEEMEFQEWLKKNPNKTRYDFSVARAKASKGIGWCGFGR